VEAAMDAIKQNMEIDEKIYLCGFETFLLNKWAAKTGRNISKDTSVKIPAHTIPAFKPSKEFAGVVMAKVK
jgi:DNA-binding protein HU-beta